MSDQNQQALADFWNNTELPLTQVRENMNPANGWYDITIVKLDPMTDDQNDGMFYIQGEFSCVSKAGDVEIKAQHRERYYLGTHEDPKCQQPATLLNCAGLSRLKAIARVTDVPANNQKPAALAAALIGKQYTNRIETTPGKGKNANREFCNQGRNPVKLGVVPAKLDGATVANGQAGAATSAGTQSAALAGATFGAE